MQLTLLASLAVLFSAAFAAPSKRDGSDSLAEIIACACLTSLWKYELTCMHRCGQRLERHNCRRPQAG